MTTIQTFAVARQSDGTFKIKDASVSVEFKTGLGIRIIGIDDFPARELLLRTIKALSASGCIVGNRKITVDVDFGMFGLTQRSCVDTSLFDLPLAIAIMNELGFAKFDTSPTLRYIGMLRPDGRVELLGDSVFLACKERVYDKMELICANTTFYKCGVDPGHVYLESLRRAFNLNKNDGESNRG